MPKVNCWLEDDMTRIFPGVAPGKSSRLSIDAAIGERVAFQVAVRGDLTSAPKVEVFADAPKGVAVRVRQAGCVPLPHFTTLTERAELDGAGFLPGMCPDPLFENSSCVLPYDETISFWITLETGGKCLPGKYGINLRVEVDGKTVARPVASLNVFPVRLKGLKDFPVTHWFYADALLDWYRLKPWEEKFWGIFGNYARNLTSHRQDTIYVPLFTPPLDGVKRPNQLLHVKVIGKDKYSFDWRNVRKWIDIAKKAGLKRFEWCHLFTQWGVKNALRIYDGANGDGKLLWPAKTGATSKTYRLFLSQLLPELEKFLKREKLLDKSFFHVSDEPHGEEHLANYRKARNLLKELAPWMKVMDALSDIEYGRQGLTDTPIPTIATALKFREENIPSWCYFCCSPRGGYLNRFLDTPLAKIRMAGWLFHRFEMKGFLHWGYNYWYRSQTSELIDPFSETASYRWPGWTYGDPFLVYPGENGPLDSIRWEVWNSSMQDMALLQAAGMKPEDDRLGSLKSFADFPKTAKWINGSRKTLLQLASKGAQAV